MPSRTASTNLGISLVLAEPLASVARVLCSSELNSFLPFAWTVCVICTRILAIQSSLISWIRTCHHQVLDQVPHRRPLCFSQSPDDWSLHTSKCERCWSLQHPAQTGRSKTRRKHYLLLSSEWKGGLRVLPFVPCQPYKVPTLERSSPHAVHKTPACLQSFGGVQEMGCLCNTAGTLLLACSLHPTLPRSAPSS